MRPTKYQMMMQIAHVVKMRSTCARLQVGCVISNLELTQILSMGYNGMEAGGKNECDTDLPGQCGCIHAEVNALIKASPGPKLVFVTTSPCLTCARLMINAGAAGVYYGAPYRVTDGLNLLIDRGVHVDQVL